MSLTATRMKAPYAIEKAINPSRGETTAKPHRATTKTASAPSSNPAYVRALSSPNRSIFNPKYVG
jgi:hypothetical protein